MARNRAVTSLGVSYWRRDYQALGWQRAEFQYQGVTYGLQTPLPANEKSLRALEMSVEWVIHAHTPGTPDYAAYTCQRLSSDA